MPPDRRDHYRRLIALHRGNKDPTVSIKVSDLRVLLDTYEWYAADRRPKPPLTQQELAE